MERLKMNIVKHSKGSNLQRVQKKPFPSWINMYQRTIPAIILGSLLGTYLDLYFVGKGLYEFPTRPLSHIFSINLTFTLIALPLFTMVFLLICSKLKLLKKISLILLLSLFMAVAERAAEGLGLFAHHYSWKHQYSFIGYTAYLTVIYLFFHWSRFRI
ncbi:CBO0543 family protein [Schinkia azotoformans]|uniref:CBO0543 family protein n=2 Tax=Schinkia azotoformans TaxID=1454 RepID=UPI002DBBF1D7|nr:CBO0543 family protein [Schinkia azotoformans]